MKKNSKIFSTEGPCENVWGPRENVSPGPAVALGGPVRDDDDEFCVENCL